MIVSNPKSGTFYRINQGFFLMRLMRKLPTGWYENIHSMPPDSLIILIQFSVPPYGLSLVGYQDSFGWVDSNIHFLEVEELDDTPENPSDKIEETKGART